MAEFMTLSIGSISISLLAGALLLFFIWIWRSWRSYTKFNIPPFPAPLHPVLGHALLFDNQLRKRLAKWREQVGDFVSIDVAGRLNIVVNGFENIKNVLKESRAPDRDMALFSFLLGHSDHGIASARGANWKAQRRECLKIFKELGFGTSVITDRIVDESKVYVRELEKLEGKAEDVKEITRKAVCNIICIIALGKRFDYQDPEYHGYMDIVRGVLARITDAFVVGNYPFLHYLPGDLFGSKFIFKLFQQFDENFTIKHMEEALSRRKEQKEQHCDDNEKPPQNYIEAYLRDIEVSNNNSGKDYLDIPNLLSSSMNLFFGAAESTATTITWCILYSLHHQEEQEKLYREITTHVGSDRYPCWEDQPKLNYLRAFILETQRLASVVPITDRLVLKTFEMNGYEFPEGSIILCNFDSVHHDKGYWGDPYTFRPERFLDSEGEMIKSDRLIPFSYGKRSCVGEFLARAELFLFVGALFQRFRFEPEDDLPLQDVDDIVFKVAVTPKSFKVKCLKRV